MDAQDPIITAAQVALDRARAEWEARRADLERIEHEQAAAASQLKALADATLARRYLDANRGDVEGGQRGVHIRPLGSPP